MKPKVYVTRALPEIALAVVAEHCDLHLWPHADQPVPREHLRGALAGVQGVLSMVTERWDKEILAAAPRLKVIANMAVGYDNIVVPHCTERGVLVTNTPGVLTETTADLTWGLLMAAARRIPEGDQLVRKGGWKSWSPLFLVGQDLFGKTLGIIGMGEIGSAVARRARGFNMKVRYHNRTRSELMESALGAEYRSLDDLLGESDFVVVLVPLSAETVGLIGARELDQMKETAVLVNASRGGIVDETALYDALKKGRIWAAGLDVFAQEPVPVDHPLLTLPNLVALPHIGSATVATRTKMALRAAENLVAAVTEQRPPNLVNPEAWQE
jgi:glyoxylate reductase